MLNNKWANSLDKVCKRLGNNSLHFMILRVQLVETENVIAEYKRMLAAVCHS